MKTEYYWQDMAVEIIDSYFMAGDGERVGEFIDNVGIAPGFDPLRKAFVDIAAAACRQAYLQAVTDHA